MKTMWKKMMVAGLLAGLAAGLCPAAEMVLDRQGGWEVVQSDDGNAASLFLMQTSDGARTCLASVELPTTTVTNSYWDEYAGWDEAAGRPAGAMVTRVDTVGAEFRFTAFVNDGQAYWEDWADGTARLWTAPCKTPDEKTLLAETGAGMAGNAFHARPWRRGAMWRQAASDGSGGTTMVRVNGKNRSASVREQAALAKSKSARSSTAKESGTGTYDYSGSMPDYDCQSLFFDANGGQFEDGSQIFDHTDYWPDYPISGTGVYDFWYSNYFQFPIREGYAFNGWYSSATGGTRVKEGDPVSSDLTRTVYAHWVPTSGTSLAEALDYDKLSFTTEGDVPWFGQKDTSHDGTDAARSGQLVPEHAGRGSSTLSATVQGPGTVSFWWKADGLPSYYDENRPVQLSFLVDEEAWASLKTGPQDWKQVSFAIGEGTHELTWEYQVGGQLARSYYYGLDCGFVDQISWKFEGKQTVTFDPNGGVCETETASYQTGEAYGSLPEASRDEHDFAGWYTAPTGGTLVTAQSIVDGPASMTLYAHWQPFVRITNVVAHQRFPWNGLVDIDYEVFCDDPDAWIWVVPEAFDGEHECALVMETLTGDGANMQIKPGCHRMTWDAKTDNPGAHTTALTVKMKGANASQTISFAAIGPQTPADRVNLSATATSGLAVTFEVVSGPGVVTGNVLTFTGEGAVEVRAVQSGDNRWLPATVAQSVAVAKLEQTIDFAAIGPQTPADRVELSATATSGLAVTFEVVSGPGVVTGNVLTFTGEGTVEVRAVQAGDNRWLPASATQSVVVAKLAQTIDFAAIGDQTWQDRVELSARATSGLAVTFEVVSGPGVVSGNVLSFTGEGTVEVRAVQAGDERWQMATATQTVAVAKVPQTISFAAIGAQLATNRVTLSATATSGLAVTFEVVSGPGVVTGNVLTFTGEGTVEVRAVQAGDERWQLVTATQRVVVVEDGAYLVVDLSAGADASSYPVTELDAMLAGGFNTDEYKTTKLVLRRIEPGTFMMGGSYETTLTKPFYVGVFEVTQKQWELVMGSNPSYYKGNTRPVEKVTYNMIRGSSAGAGWPGSSAVDATSFLGKLRARTGLSFDLPTEAQWEYACRAGTTSDYNNGGNSENDLKQLGRYWYNRSDGKGGYTDAHTTVGSYLPNAWGLYDMHGNVWEGCLDWYGSLTGGVTDPVGPSSDSARVIRGGSWDSVAGDCTSSLRYVNYYPSSGYYCNGFRLVRTLSE